MNLKTDTKEKFTVITPEAEIISANMADELALTIQEFQNKKVPHVILNLGNVQMIDGDVADRICLLMDSFANKNQSFVICCMNDAIEDVFESKDMLELINTTPSESEAWDIVQMEEIERELLNDDGEE